MDNVIISISGGVLIAVGVLFLVMMTGGFFMMLMMRRRMMAGGRCPCMGMMGKGEDRI